VTLQTHLTWLKMEALRHGWGDPEWLFPNEEGKPAEESRVRKIFKRALRTARLPEFRFYDLRHTYASLLLAAGAPITYVSAQLGHANASTTLRWYARWLPRTDRRAVDMPDDGWVNAVDRLSVAQIGTVGSQLVANPGSEDESGAPNDFEAPDLFGGPSGTRTPDPLIKSQLLCQLS